MKLTVNNKTYSGNQLCYFQTISVYLKNMVLVKISQNQTLIEVACRDRTFQTFQFPQKYLLPRI